MSRAIVVAGSLLLCVTLAIASALFSGVEAALLSLKSFHIQRLKGKDEKLAASIEILMKEPRTVVSASLIGGAITNLPLLALGIFLMREVLPRLLPFPLEALIFFTVLVLFCEFIPKLIALGDPCRFARVGVFTLPRMLPIFEPISRLLQRCSEEIAEWIIPRRTEPHRPLSAQEFETLSQLAVEEGALLPVEGGMIQEIIKLGEKTARDCMTPRTDAFAVPDDLTNEEIIPMLQRERHRRVPVYDETPDNIIGIIDVAAFLSGDSEHYTESMIPPSFVSETMKALDLLRSFLTHPQGLAIIVDEYGGTEGIVTMADIMKEIFGDAAPDEESELYIEKIEEKQLLVSGNARLDDLGERLGINLEEEGIDTIGGMVFNHLGYLPKPGSDIVLRGLSIHVRSASKKRLSELVVSLEAPGKSAKEDPA